MSELSNQIMEQTSMKRIMEYYGVQTKGKQYLCPFHQDTNPSMSVTPDDKGFICFSCHEKGNALNFIKEYEEKVNGKSMNWREVYQKAIEIQGLNIVLETTPNKTLTPAQRRKARQKQIMQSAVELSKYEMSLESEFAKNAREYLKRRNISEKTIKNFNIGIDFDYSLTNKLSKDKNRYTRDEMIDVGLLKTGVYGTMDTFNNRVIVPICDRFGNPVGFGGRVLGDTKPKYLNTSETELFKKSQILFNYHQAKIFARDNELVVVEGYFDVISAYEMEMKNVTALMGLGLSEEQIKMIKELNCDVVLSLDNDERGKEAMLRIIPMLLQEGIHTSVYDISQLGKELKDFGDFNEKGKTKADIESTKVTAFEFLLRHKYFSKKEINAENISKVYQQLKDEGLLKNSLDEIQYKEFLLKHTPFSEEAIEDILHPKTIATGLERAMQIQFFLWTKERIIQRATERNEIAVIEFINQKNLNIKDVLNGMNDPKFIKQDGSSVNINRYIDEYIKELPKYKEFAKDNTNTMGLEELLKNIYTLDKKGKQIKVWLNAEQRKEIIQQFDNSFEKDEDAQDPNATDGIHNQKEYILAHPDRYTKIVIADTAQEYDNLFPKSMLHNEKLLKMIKFKTQGLMGYIDYFECFPKSKMEDLQARYKDEYVTKNGEFKVLLVYNNIKGNITLTPENYIKPKEEKKGIKENPKRQESNQKEGINVIVPLDKTKYFITGRGVYVVDKTNPKVAVYFPMEAYTFEEKNLRLTLKGGNDLSLYDLPESEFDSKQFNRKLTKKEFLYSFNQMYYNDLKREKEERVI